LFKEVYEQYKNGIEKRTLQKSWRSAPAVLDSVNALFGKTALPADIIGEKVARRWAADWEDHVTSKKTAPLEGYAAWGLVGKKDDVAPACIEIINTVQPLERELSCAILVRTNPEVASMAQALREAGIPASMEGEVEIARDNVLGAWILAFLYSLARPGESFPRAYLSMCGVDVDDREYNRLAGLFRMVLSNDGYAEAVRRLLNFLEPLIYQNRFLKRRSEQLLESINLFEGTESRSLEGLITFLESAKVAESTLHEQVQVMTVHKAKGLDFDMVIVAGFGTRKLVPDSNRSIHAHRRPDGEVGWVLDLPRKGIVEQDPVLKAASKEHQDNEVFEALCLMYVAMTRARLAMYCIAEKPGTNTSIPRWHEVMTAAYGCAPDPREDGRIAWQREWGPADWFTRGAAKEKRKPDTIELDAIAGPLPECRTTLRRMPSPSQESHGKETAVRSLRSNAGRLFGTQMHDFLATIEWVNVEDEQAINRLLEEVDESLKERLEGLLKSPEGMAVFKMPDADCALWREKPYVLRRGNYVAQGIIDRAVIYHDASGNPVRAVIHDFKTDQLDPDRPAKEQLLERYSIQLERYSEAVSVLTGLPESAISTNLVPV
jgi:ATP-dependent exoDNAse (exonuclease V) beta subunit